MNDINELERELESLRALRDRLKSVDKAEELSENSADIREYLKDEIDTIDKELKEIEEKSKQLVEEYDKLVKQIQEELEENEKKLEDSRLYSDEEILELRERKDRQILELNERSVANQRTYDEIKKLKTALKSKKTTLEKRIKESEALGLSYNEYKDVYSVYRSRKLMDRILSEKGLDEIINKDAKDRTKEEKELLNKTKEEILKEIADFRRDKEYEDYTVLDIVEALYSLDTKYTKVEEPRKTQIKNTDLMVISENKQLIPYKVVNPFVELNNLIQQLPEKEEAPKDMEGAKENEKVDINDLKPAEEKVTLFKDKDSSEYYVRKYAVERFKLKSADLGNEVRINGSLCYKISESDVEKIKENANNAFSPYIADIKEIELEKKEEAKKDAAPSIPLPPMDEPKEDLTTDDIKGVLDEALGENKGSEDTLSDKEKEEIIRQINESIEEQKRKAAAEIEKLQKGFDEELARDKELEEAKKARMAAKAEKEKYEAKNVKASEKFKEELKQNNIVYRIVHAVPKFARKAIDKFKGFFDTTSSSLEDHIELGRVK